jgi:hypothetical protein
MRIGKIILKAGFIIVAFVLPLKDDMDYAREGQMVSSNKIMPAGMYSVNTFVRNKDTIPASANDSLRWQDVIIDNAKQGSIKTNDTLFRMRYGRGYFKFYVNEKAHTINFSKRFLEDDSLFLFKMQYSLPDSNIIHLRGLVKSDSVFVALKKNYHHFQLTERQFHWLSEYNR